MIDQLIQLATTSIPVLAVFAFLLLHRRQGIRAELDETRQRQEHCQLLELQRNKRTQALAMAAQAYAPAAMTLAEGFVQSLTHPPLEALEDHELFDELRRRVGARIYTRTTSADIHGCGACDEVFDVEPPPKDRIN